MTILDDMITDIIKREGRVYENHPNDRGGPTKFGITLGRLRQERGPQITWQNVRDLTEVEARQIYKDAYYNRPKIERLPDELEAAVFDWYVNSGAWAIKGLQTTINHYGYKCAVDGGIGPETVNQAYACLDAVNDKEFLQMYLNVRRQFYQDIVDRRPDQRVFLNGWYNRTDGLEKQVTYGGWLADVKRAA